VAAEFNRLFWLARKNQRGFGKEATASDPHFQAALVFAQAQGWSWAESLLEASRLDCAAESDKALKLLTECEPSVPDQWRGLFHFVCGTAHHSKREHNAAIEAYRKALDDPNFDTPGRAWNNLGNALQDKGDYDEAIKAYRKALGDPKYTSGKGWNGLGISLAHKGEHDEAIKAYRKALDDPKYENPGYVWNNLGLSLAAKGEHNEAIKAYRKALDDPKHDKPGNAWNNLGNALADAGKHNEAIKAYRKALDDPKHVYQAKTWTNLAQTYVEAGKQKLAEEAFKKALASPDPQGGDRARARAGLRLLKSKIRPEAVSPDDRAMAEKTTPSALTEEVESGIIAAIRDAEDTQYDKYVKQPDSGRDDTLSVLRGWSSAVTLLEGSDRRWRGGGYFLKWRGYGIVIDPGFDFLRNFHDAGYHGREIDVAVVSHNHSDHNFDLKALDDLRYELFSRLRAKGQKAMPYVLVWDRDTDGATKFPSDTADHRYEPVPLTSALRHPIDLLTEHDRKLPLRILPFKVQHETKGDVPHAMGMVLELLDKKGEPAVRIGYTADTAYFEDLHQHLTGCDILIAHISQPSIEELQDASKLKEAHLGYRGTARLLKECQPRLALIGEFWAGFTDLRISLVKGLRQRSGVQAVLPAGLAMHLRLPSLEIECTECKKPTPFSEIKIAPPTDNFGSLAYLCPGCMIG
jgi:tetratricopeptide (TPR) repeat protein/ribonuclease BN (tRNA processing enzyme)